jgi:hypothetical protein
MSTEKTRIAIEINAIIKRIVVINAGAHFLQINIKFSDKVIYYRKDFSFSI